MEGGCKRKLKDGANAQETKPHSPSPGRDKDSADIRRPLPRSCEDQGGDGSFRPRRANADSQASKTIDAERKKDFNAMLSDLGLKKFYPHKMTLNSVLKITSAALINKKPTSLKEIPMHFLYNVMRANIKSRNTEFSSSEETTPVDPSNTDDKDQFSLVSMLDPVVHSISILDLITAVFLCSDSLLQQMLMVNMSLCKFSLPLLLPDVSQGSITFLLWAMRMVVHKWRPHSKMESKGYTEEPMVTTAVPMISFVRIGECRFSKSSIINSIISDEKHDFFVHRDMECGNFPRRISNGLVEVLFHLPCGKTNVDVFPEIFAVSNLRGDVHDSPAQFQFLKSDSAAVFVVVENIGERECDFITSSFDPQSNVFLVIHPDEQHRSQTEESVRFLLTELKLKKENVHVFGNQNQIVFLKSIKSSIRNLLNNSQPLKTLENLSQPAKQLGIEIDGDNNGSGIITNRADLIINEIKTTDMESIKAMLPAQGIFWQDWSRNDKEMNRLKHRGDKDINEYIAQLKEDKIHIRKRQSESHISEIVHSFISACLELPIERFTVFLYWMKAKLDALSYEILTPLEDTFKQLCLDPNHDKEELKQTSKKIACSSLGLEHFMRELGQIYEASKASRSNPQFLKFPSVMAQLLINGFPMELLDGDTGCIPIDWVTDVLTEVRTQLGGDPRVFVLSVLGVQSSGKSTLLNIMFGLQFAVSSGRCTRGAFMQLIHIDDKLKRELGFDFLLVIDTEGLKAQQLATLDDSCEHDNELATVVIALSDVAIINLAMENAAPINDTLYVVVHSLIRMREAGKKPNCLFIHQNAGCVSARDKNMNDQKHLLDQLDRITKAAGKMEHKAMYYKKFTDVIAHDMNKDIWFIPGLWNGCSAMAPVSYGYTEHVLELKAYIFEKLKERKGLLKPCSLPEFGQWISTVWDSVKKETLIFSFRNILVIEAYTKLCITYADWEWKFRSKFIAWTQCAQNTIMNAAPDKLHDVHERLQEKGKEEVDVHESLLLQNIEDLFSKQSEDAHLIVKYKEDYKASAQHLAKEILKEMLEKCKETVCKKECFRALDTLQIQDSKNISQRVNDLLERCKRSGTHLSKKEIDKEFQDMWSQTVSDIPQIPDTKRNVKNDMEKKLRQNTHLNEGLVNEKLRDSSIFSAPKHSFNVKHEHIAGWFYKSKVSQLIPNAPVVLTNLSQDIINECRKLIDSQTRSDNDYFPTYWDELFATIDCLLKKATDHKIPYGKHFEIDIKVHICAIAIGRFTQQHDRFIDQNNTRKRIDSMKDDCFRIFAELYNIRDGAQKSATVFCNQCLKPALMQVIYQRLGPKIVEDMKRTCTIFFSRKNLQKFLLSDLLEKDEFNLYTQFLDDYKSFTTLWIKKLVINHCKENIISLLNYIFKEIVEKAKKAVSSLLHKPSPVKVSDLLEKLQESLAGDIVMQKYAIGIIGTSKLHDSNSIKLFCNEMNSGIDRVSLEVIEFAKFFDVESLLDKLTVRPHEELFKLLAGCGNTCPLCKAPCDQGGRDHREHQAILHYPQGLCGQTWNPPDKLSVDVCTTSVSKRVLFFFKVNRFANMDTKGKYVRYTDYRTVNKYYASWNIPEDLKLEAPLFWKFVFNRFNEEFAKRGNAQPAEIPRKWKCITKQQVELDLQQMYGFIEISE
ncbi:interferon-induced very large GTPase 1-like [Petromyzon marinus]|uniref:interferon-induced very large GTPase 1-like n=1 Tax=Petromyzon marinus TaxID=7757 RepID=UPI003F71507B